ncbi:ATP-grasp domain-containing protein [Streptacidiphilus sp. N1-3]|uniref:ATP-grasp domain-containing protein n=1 Tax=Streptacidiphilus alkalitolerans TaxID=3342712 RepID=A0ABV6WTR4_9ACTN
MPPHILIVGGGRRLHDEIRAAAAGVRTTTICRMSVLPKINNPQRNARLIAMSNDATLDEWLAMAEFLHTQDPFTAVAAWSEVDQEKGAAIGERLGIDAPDRETVRLVNDKAAMRHRLALLGLDDTRVRSVSTVEEARAAVAFTGLPCVLKPDSASGSRGVSVLRDLGELEAAWAWARAAEPESTLLVEEFLSGTEYSVEAMSEGGVHRVVTITGKFSDSEHRVEEGHVVPALLPAAQAAGIADFVERALSALGVVDGVTHTEIIETKRGPRMVETHLRPAGGWIPLLVRDALGVDLLSLLAARTVDQSVLQRLPGERSGDPEPEPKDQLCAAIWFIQPETGSEGELLSLFGVEHALDTPGVVEVQVLGRPGDRIGTLRSSGTRLAMVRAIGPDQDSAVAAAREGASRIRAVVVPPAEAGPLDGELLTGGKLR